MKRKRESSCSLAPLTAMLVSVGFLLHVGAPAHAAGAQASPRPSLEQVLTLDISVNGVKTGRWSLLDRNGILYAPKAAFAAWKVSPRPKAESVEHQGQIYLPLASVPGFEARILPKERRAAITFGKAELAATGESSPNASTAPALPTAPVVAAGALPGPPKRQSTQAAPASTPNSDRLIPLEVLVNSAAGGQWVFLERLGVLHATEEAFDEWRLVKRPSAASVRSGGQNYYALDAVPGFEARLNLANQSVSLVFSPSAFAATRLTNEALVRPALSPAEPAGFLNYDLSYTQANSASTGGTRDLGALVETGFSNRWGVVTSTYVGRGLTNADPLFPATWRRLETTFSRDFLDSGTSLRVGDSATRSGVAGRSVFFGGVQFGRNFGLIPGFVSQPKPTVSGTSSAPSTVELYVNDALRQVSSIPTGPFAIDNFPLLSGGGQARLVVRDLLGRETVLVTPFFSHGTLLEQGLMDWNVALGAVRRNQGTDNANYGQRFASGFARYGFTKTLTAEFNTDWGQDTKNVGLGLSWALPTLTLTQFALTQSQDKTAGQGTHWLLGAEQAGLQHGFSARAEGATAGYRQMGAEAIALSYRTQLSGNYTYSSERLGSLGLGVARIDAYSGGPLTSVSANYSTRLSAQNSLTLTATRVLGSSSGTAVGMSLQMPLGERIGASSTVTRRAGQTEVLVSANQSPKGETGHGWRATAGNRSAGVFSEAGYFYQGDRGSASADVSASKGQTTVRLNAQGGLVAVAGSAFITRRVDASFALVEVPGYANVGVQFQGSTLARTNASGIALLPRLAAYQSNSIQLDPAELPVSAELDNLEQIAVPAARGAVKVVFPVRSGRGALIKIVFSDQEPAPAGAQLELAGDKKEFFVARRGEAFVTGLQTKNTLTLRWNGASCTMPIELPPGSIDDIARVGPVLCAGIKR